MASRASWVGWIVLAGTCGCASGALWGRGEEAPVGVTEEQFRALNLQSSAPVAAGQGQRVELDGVKAWLSVPEGVQTPMPGVLVLHVGGEKEGRLAPWADRLASEGYAALALELRGMDEARVLEVLRVAHEFLKTDSRVQATRTAVIGWSGGGGWSLRAAMEMPDLDAVVMYYGGMETQVDRLSAINAALLAFYGTRDTSTPLEQVQAFDTALSDAGVAHRFVTYEAAHAFANPATEQYDEQASADAWEQVKSFLSERLRQ